MIPFLKHNVILKLGYIESFLRYNNVKNAEFEKSRFLSYEGRSFKDFYVSCDFEYNSFNKLWYPDFGFAHNFKFYLSLPLSDLKYIRFDYSINFLKEFYSYILQVCTNF